MKTGHSLKQLLSSQWINTFPRKRLNPDGTTDIKRLCRRKKRGWDAGKHHRNSHAWKRYLKLNKQVKDRLQKAHRDYIDNILNVSITENPKKVYSYIKHKKYGESGIPALKPDQVVISDPTEKAAALNVQYTLKCLNIGTPNATTFQFVSNEK